jgi:FMN reductase
VDALRRADGIVLATPSYHGSLTGLLKNALDYVEALRQDERVYFQDRAVGCLVCADGPQAMGPTLTALRSIVHALRGWPTPYGAAIASQPRPFGAEPSQDDPAALKACETVAEEVVGFARRVQAERMRA